MHSDLYNSKTVDLITKSFKDSFFNKSFKKWLFIVLAGFQENQYIKLKHYCIMYNTNQVDLIPPYNYMYFNKKTLDQNGEETNIKNLHLIKLMKQDTMFELENTFGDEGYDIMFDKILCPIPSYSPNKIAAARMSLNSKMASSNEEFPIIDDIIVIWVKIDEGEGKFSERIASIICKKSIREDVYRFFFIKHMTEKEESKWWYENSPHQSSQERNDIDRDNFLYGFDGDIDAWNHWNQ